LKNHGDCGMIGLNDQDMAKESAYMKKRRIGGERGIFALYALLIGAFFIGILWINLHSGPWYHFDIYADVMVAKHMSRDHSFFPEGWIFGNQLYTVATPAVAALFYTFLEDSVLSMGLASIVMTVLTLGSFLWCIGPFTGRRSKLVGLLCLIGGTIFGTSAASDTLGLQVFYTMASYYACYMIGIFLTLGIFLRIYSGRRVPVWIVVGDLLLNLLLGMQSLREILVLNLPLAAMGVLCLVGKKDRERKTPAPRTCFFGFGALAFAIGGVVLIKLLGAWLPISQVSTLARRYGSLLAGVKHNIVTLGQYIGLQKPADGYGWMKLAGGIFCILMVVYASVMLLLRHLRDPLTQALLYGWLSIGAVFCAGVLVLETRHIYYFPWQILVALSAVATAEKVCTAGWKRWVALLALLVIGASSLYYNFRLDVERFDRSHRACRGLARALVERNITHVYYDADWVFYGPQIAAYGGDRITMPGIFVNRNTTDHEDLLRRATYLCPEEWYTMEDRDSAYLLLSAHSLALMEPEYKEALMSHLTPELEWRHIGIDYYFYSFDESLARDIQNGK